MGAFEGTVYQLMVFPMPWPPQTATSLHASLTPCGSLELLVLPQGNLRLWLREKKEVLFESVPVDITEGDTSLLIVGWSESGARVSIGNQRIPPAGEGGRIQIKLGIRELGSDRLSFEADYAREACKKWMIWRTANLLPLTAGRGRVEKSFDDQIGELRGAIKRVEEITQIIQHGKNYWLGSLAVELRSLLVWKDRDFRGKGPEFPQVPLLLRVAALKDLPLPVFVYPRQGDKELSVGLPTKGFAGAYLGNIFSIRHQHATDVLVDIQDWLIGAAVFKERLETVEIRDAIAGYAETLGPGHYDMGVPSYLLRMRSFGAYNSDVMTIFLCGVASAAVDLAKWVLAD